MRTLSFIVDGQTIKKDPKCDFEHIVSGTKGYLKAHFTFSSEWESCVKVARFFRGSKEVAVVLENDECFIPDYALVGTTFRVGAIGAYDNYRITTGTIAIRQEVSK